MQQPTTVRGTVLVRKKYVGPAIGFLKPGTVTEEVRTANIVTTAGLRHYAQRSIGATPTDTFRAVLLFEGAANTALDDVLGDCGVQVVGSLKRMSSQYPVTDDQDPMNQADAGPDVTTYKVVYSAAEAISADIAGVCVTNYAGGAPSSSEPLLMHARFPSISKTDQEELTIIINHKFGNA